MAIELKLFLFVAATSGLLWVSRSSLKDMRFHGFYRFFAWEAILVLFLLNMEAWFSHPFGPRQLVSWLFLIISLLLVTLGVRAFRQKGQVDQVRIDERLLGIEKTTVLVTSGVYHFIRHPFYASLLFLAWGILLKNVSWLGSLLAMITTLLLTQTARMEEIENIQYFGVGYREYMHHTRMFIPYIF